jgi:hypothetical protein
VTAKIAKAIKPSRRGENILGSVKCNRWMAVDKSYSLS